VFPINPAARSFKILNEVTDPILRPLRRIVPPLGMLDITPIVALVLIQIVGNLLVQALAPVGLTFRAQVGGRRRARSSAAQALRDDHLVAGRVAARMAIRLFGTPSAPARSSRAASLARPSIGWGLHPQAPARWAPCQPTDLAAPGTRLHPGASGSRRSISPPAAAV